MERQQIHEPLDREAVYHAIWPELADDIHPFGATDFMVDRMSDAEGYALEYLLDQIEGNACTPVEAIAMARDLIVRQPDADDYDDARFAPLWYVVITTPEALKMIHALLAATPNAARQVGDTVYFERRDEADWIGTLVAGEVIGISLADPPPPPPQLRQLQRLAAKQRRAGYYSKHSTDQMIKAIIYRANAGEPLSEYEQDFLRELDHEDRGTAEDRNPC